MSIYLYMEVLLFCYSYNYVWNKILNPQEMCEIVSEMCLKKKDKNTKHSLLSQFNRNDFILNLICENQQLLDNQEDFMAASGWWKKPRDKHKYQPLCLTMTLGHCHTPVPMCKSLCQLYGSGFEGPERPGYPTRTSRMDETSPDMVSCCSLLIEWSLQMSSRFRPWDAPMHLPLLVIHCSFPWVYGAKITPGRITSPCSSWQIQLALLLCKLFFFFQEDVKMSKQH